MNIKIEKLSDQNAGDFIKLILLFERVFDKTDMGRPDDKYLTSLLTKSNFLAFVAKNDNEVLGGLTAYVLDQYHSKKPLAYIYDLAVEVNHQRQGIGRKLIENLIQYCKLHDFEGVFVQAERADEYAVTFYRSTNITDEQQVLHFYYSL